MQEIADFTTDSVDAFISAANLLVNREVLPYTEMDEEGLTELETWLAVHFVRVKEGMVTQESVSGTGGSVSRSFNYKQTGKYLTATLYGQQAMVLDDTGRLRALNDQGNAVVGLDHIRTYPRNNYYG